MLKLYWLSNQACQTKIWKGFDATTQVWVVSDAKSKSALEEDLLSRSSIISRPVKRAKEFWTELLSTWEPELTVIENLGTKVAARQFLDRYGKSEWCKRPRAPEKLLEACQTLAPLIAHESVVEILTEFENKFKGTSQQFLEVSHLAAKFYLEMIVNKRVPHFLVPTILSKRDQLPQISQEAVFDLGMDLKEGEKDLIQRLSRNNPISVLIPASDAKGLIDRGLRSYLNFEVGLTEVKNIFVEDENPREKPEVTLWRCSSPEAEARQAVEKISGWIRDGVAMDAIRIVSPAIKNYEDVLDHDLGWEGLGYQRSLKSALSCTRIFRSVNACLKIIDGEISAHLLEEAFLTLASYRETKKRWEEQRTFGPIDKIKQIPQSEIQDKVTFLRSKKSDGPLTLREFESLVGDIFEGAYRGHESFYFFVRALQNLRSEVADQVMDLRGWIMAWGEATRLQDLPLVETSRGVQGSDLDTPAHFGGDHLVVLGCSESRSSFSVVQGLDAEKLQFLSELGFDFSPPQKNINDLKTQWLLSGHWRSVTLSSPKVDSSGKTVAASPLWIQWAAERNRDLEKLETAHHTQWIALQKSILSATTQSQLDLFKGWQAGRSQTVAKGVHDDIEGKKVALTPPSTQPLPFLLSASQLENYWKCPFKFYARSYLKLFDEDDLDIEPSHQSRGQWIHSALEKIMTQKEKVKDWNTDELSLLIDSLDQVQKKLSLDIWPSIKSRFLRQLVRFIDTESKWQEAYPRCKPQLFESALEGYIIWNENDLKFSKDESPSGQDHWARFKGRVDRIDVTADGKKAVILDYKTGSGSLDNIESWVKNGNFQLGLYTEALEAGLSSLPSPSVLAAQFYAVKTLKREKGFKIIDEIEPQVLPLDSNNSCLTREARDTVFKELNETTKNILESIRKGDLSPQPHDNDEKICERCRWRNSCRATHLN